MLQSGRQMLLMVLGRFNHCRIVTFQMHTLDKAGHWVHVDDLEGSLELMVEALRQRGQLLFDAFLSALSLKKIIFVNV
ncbi:LOW QUALITY PROTEIN: hypothetical protein ACHAW6_015646 [Cyclotella cf. meneghiniana]